MFIRKSLLFLTLMTAIAAMAQDKTPGSLGLEMSNLPAQKVGPEDMILVRVYDSPDLTRTVRISAEGTIRMPMLKKEIPVNGMFPAEIEVLVADAFKSEQLLVDPSVTVSVVEYHSRPISVNGAVKTPIVFQAIGKIRLLDAIARAGGLGPEAGGEILITKPNGDTGVQSMTHVPVKALLNGSDPQLNLTLVGGEEVRVPPAGTVVVSGNVRDPGVFPVQENGTTTVMTAIAQAKGLADYQPKLIYILRPDERGQNHEIEVDLKAIMQRKKPDVVLQAKDLLYVPLNGRARITDKAVTALTGTGTSAATALIYTRGR